MDLPEIAVGNVPESVEILILGRDLDAAAPSARAVVVKAVGVGELGSVDDNLIIMEADNLGFGITGPRAIRPFGQRVFNSANVEQDVDGFRCDNPGPDPALRIDLGVFLVILVGAGGFPPGIRLVFLCEGERRRQGGRKCDPYNWVFHGFESARGRELVMPVIGLSGVLR